MSTSTTVWCSLPWYSFDDLGSHGYRPCSFHKKTYVSQDPVLENRWRSRDSGDIRYALLNGHIPAGCTPCKDHVDATGQSFRLKEIKRLGLSQQIDLQTISSLAGPRSLSVCLDDDSQEKTIPDHLMNELTHLTFYGAEPFSSKPFCDSVSRMVETGDAAHVSLALTTELSADAGDILMTLAQFGNLTVQVNILDLGSRLEFLMPGSADSYFSRLKSLRDLTTPGTVSVFIRVNILNVFNLMELLERFRAEFPDFQIHLDTGSTEPSFHIRNLPPKAKSEAGHLLKFIDPEKFNFSADHGPRSVIESLSMNGDSHLITSAISRILKDTGHKAQELREAFPILCSFIEVPA